MLSNRSIIVLLFVAIVMVLVVTTLKVSPITTSPELAGDYIVRVGGTGTLEEVEVTWQSPPPRDKYYRLTGPGAPSVDLGFLNEYTEVLNFADDQAMKGTDVQRFVGKRLTVLAEIDVVRNKELVLKPLVMRKMIILNGTMVVR